MRLKHIFSLIIGLLLVALFLSACGGSSSEPQDTFTITATEDFTYSPDAVIVRAGEEVTLTFKNEGSVDHSLNILNTDEELEHVLEGAHEEEELHEELLIEFHEIAAGETTTETFIVDLEPGDYTFFCSLPGHGDAGLVGTLTVIQ